MATQQPNYTAYTVIKREKPADDYWLAIGAAFEHADGSGFNVVLQALPIDGKIVLRLPKAQEEKPPAQQQPANPKRRETRRL